VLPNVKGGGSDGIYAVKFLYGVGFPAAEGHTRFARR
jgi:hypothetical protein